MSHWKIAAAQYEPLKTSVTEHVAHHLQFIQAAAQCQCELLVFPSLSLMGCVDENDALPASALWIASRKVSISTRRTRYSPAVSLSVSPNCSPPHLVYRVSRINLPSRY